MAQAYSEDNVFASQYYDVLNALANQNTSYQTVALE